MKNSKIIRIIIDSLMLVLMLFEYSKVFTGQLVHEIIGIALFVLFVIHNILNISFYKNIFKGKYNLRRIITTIGDISFLLLMVATIFLGIAISNDLFKFLNSHGSMQIRSIHTILGYWNIVILAIHLGLHFNMIFKKFENSIKDRDNIKLVYCLIQIVIVVYGILVIINNDFVSYLIGKSSFGKVEANIFMSLLNNLSEILSISIIVFNIDKLLTRRKHNE